MPQRQTGHIPGDQACGIASGGGFNLKLQLFVNPNAIELNFIQDQARGGGNMSEWPIVMALKGLFDIIQTYFTPSQTEKLSHNQTYLITHESF